MEAAANSLTKQKASALVLDSEIKQKASELFVKATQYLSPDAHTDHCQGFFEDAWAAGQQKNRYFHDSEHFFYVAGRHKINNWLDAVHFRAGINHDAVYHHIDIKEYLQNDKGSKGFEAKGFAPGIKPLIDPYLVAGSPLQISGSTALDDDRLFQAALTIFGYDNAKRKKEGIVLDPFDGQNEFLSALYGMRQAQALGIPDKFILAEMAHIEGTIPFKPHSFPYNRFELLQDRLADANSKLADNRLTRAEIEKTIHSAVEMANRDVSSFKWKFNRFIAKTFLFNAENVQGSVENLNKPAPFFQNCLGTALFLESVVNDPYKAIFHGYHNIPHKSDRMYDEGKAKNNIRTLREYLTANAVAVSLMTAMENTRNDLHDPQNVKLDDIFLRKYRLKPSHTAELTEYGKKALGYAKKDGGALISDPVAAFLLEELGSETIIQLGNLALANGIEPAPPGDPQKQPYPKPGIMNPQAAADFLKKIDRFFKDKDMDFTPVRQQLEAFRAAPVLENVEQKVPDTHVFDITPAKTMTSAIALGADYGRAH